MMPSDERLSREPGIVDLDADLGLPRAARLAMGLLLATAVAAMLLLALSLTGGASDPGQGWARMPVPIVQPVPSAWRTPTGSEAQPPAPLVDLESPDV